MNARGPTREQIKNLESELQRVAKEQWAKHPNNLDNTVKRDSEQA